MDDIIANRDRKKFISDVTRRSSDPPIPLGPALSNSTRFLLIALLLLSLYAIAIDIAVFVLKNDDTNSVILATFHLLLNVVLFILILWSLVKNWGADYERLIKGGVPALTYTFVVLATASFFYSVGMLGFVLTTGTVFVVFMAIFFVLLYIWYVINLGIYFFKIQLTRNRQASGQTSRTRFVGWDWAKGAGGTIFADVTNTMGVVAGVGGLAAIGGGLGWWWLAQIAAAMALLIVTSMLQNWLWAEENKYENSNKIGMGLNLVVGLGVLLSAVVRSDANTSFYNEVRWLWFFALIIVVAVGVVEFITGRLINPARFGVWWILLLLYGLVTVAAIVFLALPSVFSGNTYVFVMALLATIAWMAAEFINAIILIVKKDEPVWLNNWTITKSMFQFVGALLLMVYLIRNFQFALADNSENFSKDVGYIVLFSFGIAISGIGALMGIISGIKKQHNKYLKKNDENGRFIELEDFSNRAPQQIQPQGNLVEL